MNYQQACDWLNEHQFFAIKLGLETTSKILAELGNPQDTFPIVHLAGTNGKGSVGATLLSSLSQGGYRVGFYSSPHLVSVRERFRLGDELISQEEFTEIITALDLFLKDRPHPTYFELTTIIGLLWFAQKKADLVILETGMGGRLDATNVVTPVISIITDISIDHEQYLGETIEKIAYEKAGIIKQGIPVIFSGRDSAALPVITRQSEQMGSSLCLLGQDFTGRATNEGIEYCSLSGQAQRYSLALSGAHQVINTSLALAGLDLLNERFPLSLEQRSQGLACVQWPGRMELVPTTFKDKKVQVLFDGAHNEAGVQQLADSLAQGYPRRRLILIWGNMADKVMAPAFKRMLALADQVIVTRAESERSASPQSLFVSLAPEAQAKTRCLEPAADALEQAMEAAGGEDLICVAGSLYLVGILRHILLHGERNNG